MSALAAGESLGERTIPFTIPILLGPGDGLTCGRDEGSAVSMHYRPPFAFEGIG